MQANATMFSQNDFPVPVTILAPEFFVPLRIPAGPQQDVYPRVTWNTVVDNKTLDVQSMLAVAGLEYVTLQWAARDKL